MRNVTKIGKELTERLKGIGIPVADDVTYTVNSRAVHRWGLCKALGANKYRIEVSSLLIRDDVPMSALKSTLIHELLHTAPRCMNHGTTWQKYANLVNYNLCYNIQRTDSDDDKGISSELKEKIYPAKYVIECQKCGTKIHRYRASEIVKHPEWYRCKCGGNLKVLKNF